MLQQRITHPAARLVVDGLASALAVLASRLTEATELAEQVLADPAAPPIAVGWAVFGGTMAAGLRAGGRTRPGWRCAVTRSPTRSKPAAVPVDAGRGSALTLGGDFDAAQARSGDIVRITSPSQYRARAMANVLAATVEFGRGRLHAAVVRLEETLAALSDETAAAWNIPARLLLAQCYSGMGNEEAANRLIAELRAAVSRGATMFEPPCPGCGGRRRAEEY